MGKDELEQVGDEEAKDAAEILLVNTSLAPVCSERYAARSRSAKGWDSGRTDQLEDQLPEHENHKETGPFDHVLEIESVQEARVRRT